MELKLIRDSFTGTATEGKLLINNSYFCETLEDCDRHMESGGIKVAHETAIPRGTYRVTITQSARFGRLMPLVNSVPGFDGIRIHPGNTDADTDGCILLGGARTSTDFITDSRSTFAQFFDILTAALEQGEDVVLEVG